MDNSKKIYDETLDRLKRCLDSNNGRNDIMIEGMINHLIFERNVERDKEKAIDEMRRKDAMRKDGEIEDIVDFDNSLYRSNDGVRFRSYKSVWLDGKWIKIVDIRDSMRKTSRIIKRLKELGIDVESMLDKDNIHGVENVNSKRIIRYSRGMEGWRTLYDGMESFDGSRDVPVDGDIRIFSDSDGYGVLSKEHVRIGGKWIKMDDVKRSVELIGEIRKMGNPDRMLRRLADDGIDVNDLIR